MLPRPKIVVRLALVGYACALVWSTHLPQIPVKLRVSDKLLHFGSYACLAMLVLLAGATSARLRAKWRAGYGPLMLSIAMAALAIWGFMDELTQPWVGRQFDMADWTADLAGIGLATILGSLLFSKWNTIATLRSDQKSASPPLPADHRLAGTPRPQLE